jgi:predicted Zn-dependent protease
MQLGIRGAKLQMPTLPMLYIHHQPGSFAEGTHRALQAADGYLYLGMPDDALKELGEVPNEDSAQPTVLLARTRVLLHLKQWSEAEKLAARGSETHPDHEEFTVQRAFALHQLKQGDEAMNVILQAPEWIRQTGIIHYNLACYEAQLGDLGTARQCIKVACQMNKAMKKNAAIDPICGRCGTNSAYGFDAANPSPAAGRAGYRRNAD